MKKEEKTETFGLGVTLTVPEEVREGRYSNYFTVGHSPDEFHMFFAQVAVSPELLPKGTAPAKVIAHIILAPSAIPRVMDALSKNYDRYRQGQKKATRPK